MYDDFEIRERARWLGNALATNTCSAVSGGQTNTADGINSVVGGGHDRTTDKILHARRAGDLFQSE